MANLPEVKISQIGSASSTDYVDTTTFPATSGATNDTKKFTLAGLKSNYFCDIHCASLTIASADVLQLNSTPLTIVSAVAGKVISVLDFSMSQVYGTTPYATNTNLAVKCSGADAGQMQMSAVLAHTISGNWGNWTKLTASTAQTQLIENADLQVYVPTGDPTAGDSDIEVFVLYRLI